MKNGIAKAVSIALAVVISRNRLGAYKKDG